MNSSKTAVMLSTIWGKLLNFIGYSIGAFTLILIIYCLTDLKTPDTVVALYFFIFIAVLCVLAVITGTKIKKRIKRFKVYVGLISIEGITLIDEIAANTSQSVDFVTKDLQKMIDKRYFSSAHLSKNTNQIIIGHTEMSRMQSNTGHGLQDEAGELANIKCSGCGAVNSVRLDQKSNCEYCGLSLN